MFRLRLVLRRLRLRTGLFRSDTTMLRPEVFLERIRRFLLRRFLRGLAARTLMLRGPLRLTTSFFGAALRFLRFAVFLRFLRGPTLPGLNWPFFGPVLYRFRFLARARF